MVIKIQFDKNIYQEQMLFLFKRNWANYVKSNNRRLFWGVSNFLFGFYLLLINLESGYIFLGLGIHFLYSFYNAYGFYKTNKTKLLKEINLYAETQLGKFSLWEFKESYFRSKDDSFNFEYKWNNLENFEIVDKNILIYLKGNLGNPYILSKKEIELKDYDNVIKLLSQIRETHKLEK